MRGRNVLAVLPPGSGASLVFELSSRVLDGVTVVISGGGEDPSP
jgi:superfamily II DNA helicase RecQ